MADKDPIGYTSNPINAFLLIKRLTNDWKFIQRIVTEDFSSGKRKAWKKILTYENLRSDYLQTVETFTPLVKLPNDEDLNGAAVALARLLETYNLNTSSVARGELNGVKYRYFFVTSKSPN